MVGYDPTTIVEENMRGVEFSDYASATTKALSHVMVLHPVATGLVRCPPTKTSSAFNH
jgi:hypothetical protein